MTYQDYLDKAGEAILTEVENAHKKTAVRCSCGQIVWTYNMIDVRMFSDRLTNGEKFVCDGCYSTWERECRSIDEGDDFIIPEEFAAKFIEKKRGKKDAGAEKVRLEYLEKANKKLLEKEAAYINAPQNHPEKVKLKSKRVKIEDRIKKG